MTSPLIGITANIIVTSSGRERTALNNSYILAVLKAGGTPVILPSGITPDHFDHLLGSLGGVLFTGGVDLNPSRYGAPMHREITELDMKRDDMELAMMEWVVKNKKPFMGICRGIEMVNVAMGGTLYTHLYDQLPNALFHTCYQGDLPRNYLAHSVHVEPSSKLYSVLGDGDVWVNSLHHQGVRAVGKNLRATAHSSDGLVEAVELVDHPFGLAVQWHPEELTDKEPMLNLFRTFVIACSN